MRRILIAALLAALVVVPTMDMRNASAQSGNTWTAFYYNNQNWAGTPVLTQSFSRIAFNWGLGSPGPGVPVDYFTGRYETDVYFYAGTYRFSLTADDEITLIVGGVTHLDTRGAGKSGKAVSVDVSFPAAGVQHVTIYYREFTSTAYVWVDWQHIKGGGPPPTPVPPPPSGSCSPQSATSVVTQFGNYTPCIQQNIHQANCFQSNGAWDAPNMGSITSEQMIEIWGNCEGDSVTSFQVSCDPQEPHKEYKCSKTWAGWFPN